MSVYVGVYTRVLMYVYVGGQRSLCHFVLVWFVCLLACFETSFVSRKTWRWLFWLD